MFHIFTFCNPGEASGHLEKVGHANSRTEQAHLCKLSTFIISITGHWAQLVKALLALLSLFPGIFDTCKTILHQHLSSSDGGLGVSRIGRDLKATRKSRMQSAIVEVQNTTEQPDDFCCLCFRLFVCFFLYFKATRKSRMQNAIVEVQNTTEKPG